MALTPEIRAPQAGIIAAVRQSAPELRLLQAQVLVPYNIPAEQVRVTYGGTNVIYRQDSQQLPVTQAQVLLVARGRIDSPRLSAWAFTLDAHENFVLKLGTYNKTLIFDILTGQWSWWSSGTSNRWRANTGMNWVSSGDIPYEFGSNIVVGDDSYGVLYILDPESGLDDPLLGDQKITFPRVATGQMLQRDRNATPVYSVELVGSLGAPSLEPNTVTFEYSDDQGHSYVVADEPQVSSLGDYYQEFSWRSVGQVRSPGRLFRITDNGAFARIDGLYVNE